MIYLVYAVDVRLSWIQQTPSHLLPRRVFGFDIRIRRTGAS